MKKFLVLFLALTFVISLAAVAFAGVSISGDARVRGIMNSNYTAGGTTGNFNSNTDADAKYWDQRVRLNVTGDVGNGIELRTRIVTSDGKWDAAAQTGGSSSTNRVYTDYAYLHVPVAGFVIDAGRMKRSWGNKLLRWDLTRDALEITTNLGDTQLGLFTEKMNDSSVSAANAVAPNSGVNNLDDDDNYGIFVKHSAGNLNAGILVIREEANETSTDTSGTEASVYVNTSVGAISIAAEAAVTSGNISGNEDSDGGDRVGAFISASTDVGAMAVTASVAMAKDSFAADSHFTPTVFFGTDSPTALANFGSASNSTTWGYVLGASTDISSDLSVNGKIAYYDLENLSSTLTASGTNSANESATEIDLGLSYKLADNAAYTVDVGYLMPSNLTTQDDNALAIAHKIEVSF